jgi:hypothetical protein
VRELPALFDVARNSAFRTWVGGISATSTPHEIEARLRELWHAHVAEVAGWVDDDWRDAVLWFGVLPELPLIACLARGGPVPGFIRHDVRYRGFIEGAAAARPMPKGADTLAPLSDGDTALLHELVRAGLAHLAAFRDPALTDGWQQRRAFESRLTALFRRAVGDLAAVFVYLTLVALDLERLRGELLRRAAFAAPTRAA